MFNKFWTTFVKTTEVFQDKVLSKSEGNPHFNPDKDAKSKEEAAPSGSSSRSLPEGSAREEGSETVLVARRASRQPSRLRRTTSHSAADPSPSIPEPSQEPSASALIREQDVAFRRVLAREGERRKAGRLQEELEAGRRAAERRRLAEEARERLSPEPARGRPDVVTVRFYTGGGAMARRFRRRRAVREIFLFLASREYPGEEYDVSLSPGVFLVNCRRLAPVERLVERLLPASFVLYVTRKTATSSG